MQLSTTEKDDLLNGIRNAAVACQAALKAFRADKSDAKREAVHTARAAYHEKLTGFITEIEKGLDLDYECLYGDGVVSSIDSAGTVELSADEPVPSDPADPETDAG